MALEHARDPPAAATGCSFLMCGTLTPAFGKTRTKREQLESGILLMSAVLSFPGPASRPHAAAVGALRAQLRALGDSGGKGGDGRGRAPVPIGVPAIDGILPAGGLARRAVHEVAPAAADDLGAANGFLLVLLGRLAARMPILWVRASSPSAGVPYPPGLAGAGVAPDRLLLLVARRPIEALWAAEEGLRAGGVAVVAEVDSLDLTASRRLQLAAEAGGGPGFIFCRRSDRRTTSAARSRWRVAAAPSGDEAPVGPGRSEAGRSEVGRFDVGRSRWQVALVRCRGGREGEWLLEWDDATDHLAVAAGLGDRSLATAARRTG